MPDPSIFTSIINSYLPEPHSSLLNGILFGVDLKSSKLFYEQLKQVGLLHIVVLSGMNITMLAAIIGVITLSLGRRASLFITATTIFLFVIFVGPEPPIVRAAIMGMLTLLSIVYGRSRQALYTLFLSGFAIAIFKPDWLATISFQLSFGATLGIILFGPKKIEFKNDWRGKFKEELKRELQTTLSAQIFTVPIIFYYFKQVSFISPLANILVSWLIAPLMILGFTTVILGKISFVLGLLPSYLCYGLLTYVVFLVEKMALIPGAFMSF